MKDKIYLEQHLLKDSFEVKKYGKELLVQIKEEEMYKKLIDRAFTEDEDSPFIKVEPHKKFNTRWGTIYKRFSRIYKRGDIRNASKDVMDIRMLRRDDDNTHWIPNN